MTVARPVIPQPCYLVRDTLARPMHVVNGSRQVRMPDAKEPTTHDAGQSLDDVMLEEIVRRIVAASQPEKIVHTHALVIKPALREGRIVYEIA